MGIVHTMQGGEVKNNFATLGAVSTYTFTVPEGRKWHVLCGYAERDVNATFRWDVNDADGNSAFALGSTIGAGVSNIWIPTTMTANDREVWTGQPLILGGGWTFVYTWGVAQTTPEVSLWVLEY